MAYTYRCNTCGLTTTKPDAYGDYDCNAVHCDGHLAYYVEMSFEPAARGCVHQDAVSEIEGIDKLLAGAVKMVFNKSASGRTAPGTTNINHLHVGGNAQLNLLFDSKSYTVLGIVNGHMDKNMKTSIRNQVNTVNSRYGGRTRRMLIDGDTIMLDN